MRRGLDAVLLACGLFLAAPLGASAQTEPQAPQAAPEPEPDPGSEPDTEPEPDADPQPAALPALSSDKAPKLTAGVTPNKGLMTGDLLTLRIRAEASAGDDLAVPQEQSFAPFELLDRRSNVEDGPGGTKVHTFELDLLALEPGDHSLPAVQVRVVTEDGDIGAVHTDPIAVRVGSLIANEPNAEPKPPTKPVVVMQEDYTLAWVLGGVGAILLTALLTLLLARWWRRRPRAAPPPPPPRPAWEVALERLGTLQRDREAALEEGRTVEWVDGVSDALRDYLGQRYGFDGLESTTDEVLARLRRARVRGTSVPEVAAVLGECDLIKFAKAPLAPERSTDLIAQAFHMVRASEGIHRQAQATVPGAAATTSGAGPGGAGPSGSGPSAGAPP